MLHAAPATAQAVSFNFSPDEVACAKRWIAANWECGLVVFPWRGTTPGDKGVMQFGQDDDGPNDYGAGTKRLLKHPDHDALENCRRGVVFEVLCADYDVDPDDPDLCAKVNIRLARDAAARAAARPSFQDAAE